MTLHKHTKMISFLELVYILIHFRLLKTILLFERYYLVYDVAVVILLVKKSIASEIN